MKLIGPFSTIKYKPQHPDIAFSVNLWTSRESYIKLFKDIRYDYFQFALDASKYTTVCGNWWLVEDTLDNLKNYEIT